MRQQVWILFMNYSSQIRVFDYIPINIGFFILRALLQYLLKINSFNVKWIETCKIQRFNVRFDDICVTVTTILFTHHKCETRLGTIYHSYSILPGILSEVLRRNHGHNSLHRFHVPNCTVAFSIFAWAEISPLHPLAGNNELHLAAMQREWCRFHYKTRTTIDLNGSHAHLWIPPSEMEYLSILPKAKKTFEIYVKNMSPFSHPDFDLYATIDSDKLLNKCFGTRSPLNMTKVGGDSPTELPPNKTVKHSKTTSWFSAFM